MTIFDRFADRTARSRVCETVIISRSLLGGPPANPIALSAAAALVMDVITEAPTHARTDLVGAVYLLTQFEPDALCRDAVALATEAASLTVQELAQLGSLDHVVDLLASERFNARRSIVLQAA